MYYVHNLLLGRSELTMLQSAQILDF
jgi:hypothetical protein